jgi:hypothetical protein
MAHGMKIAALKVRADEADAAYQAARRAAAPAFAAARGEGIPQVEPALPDGTKIALISIKRGPAVWSVDEDELLTVAACNDAGDIEDYVTEAALRNPHAVALLAEHLPELVQRRIRPARRAQYQQEWEENGGKITSALIGERVEVATVRHLPPTGDFSYRAAGKAPVLLAEAIAAGQISEWGEYLTGAPADPLPEPEAVAAAVAPATAGGCPKRGDLAPHTVASCTFGADHPGGCSWAADVARACEADDRWERARARLGTAEDGDEQPVRRPKANHPPTGEQRAILEAAATGEDIVIEAGAGAGKTAVLVMMGRQADQARPRRRGRYLAFNAPIVADARNSGEFPRSVRISTAHALAKGSVGHRYAGRMGGSKQPSWKLAEILGITRPARIDDLLLPPKILGRLVREMTEEFCKSGDMDLSLACTPQVNGLRTDAQRKALGGLLLPFARKAWDDLCITDEMAAAGAVPQVRFDHCHYLKHWQLSEPQIPVDYLLYDEAQDAARVVLDVVLKQRDTQITAVGDSAQAINGWTGAIDSLATFPAQHRLQLSKSFRFGPAVADEANKWLTLLNSDLRLAGFEQIPSEVRPVAEPDAVLCRTNAGTIAEVIALTAEGRKVALVGGGKAMRDLAEACASLKAGQGCSHPELYAFTTWAEVQEHAEHDSDLSVLVRLVDEHGPERIIQLADSLAEESDADVTVSTVHKAKGREWDEVRIAGDFHPPATASDVSPDLARLAYVAVTRARLVLDRDGLSWVDALAGAR